MAMAGLFRAGLVEWVTAMTYQAASGAGAKNMRELVAQMGASARVGGGAARRSRRRAIVDIDAPSPTRCAATTCPRAVRPRRSPAACCPGSTRTWATGRARKSGRRWPRATRSSAASATPIPMDGLCVRIGSMRCHSQALTVKLTRDVPLAEIEAHAGLGARMGDGGSEREGRVAARADAGRGDRHAAGARSAACASWRWAAST